MSSVSDYDDDEDHQMESEEDVDDDDDGFNDENSEAEGEEEKPLSEEEFVRALDELASARIDKWNSTKRSEKLQQVTNAIEEQGTEFVTVLAEWRGKCSSKHAFRRINSLYTSSLLNSVTTDDNTLLTKLIKKLCQSLHDASDETLITKSLIRIKIFALSQKDGSNSINVLRSKFLEVVNESSYIIPAVVLGSAFDLIGKNNNNESDNIWCSSLVQYSMSKFSTSSEMQLARSYLQNLSSSQWTTIVSPALQLKLKSHPDSAIETICGWIENIGDTILPVPDEEWITLLIKHLISAKENNPIFARRILIAWANQSTVCTESIASALISKAKPPLAPARVFVYETLQSIATTCCRKDVAMNESVIQQILDGLIQLVKKEPKIEHKSIGIQAVVLWVVIAKRSKSEVKSYKQALDEFIQQPVISKKSADAGLTLSTMVRLIHPDLLESIASDLWNLCDAAKTKLWEKGLEAVTESAATKKAVQVEGLLVLYFATLYSDHSSKPLLSFASKVIGAGSSKKDSPSFLYSQSMFDAVASNDIVSIVLPRVITLYTKLASNSGTNKAGPLPNLFPSGGKVTAACRAIVISCSYPTTSNYSSSGKNLKDRLASNAIINCLQTILTYQPAGTEGLINALFDQSNLQSLQSESFVTSLNSTREAREAEGKEYTMKGRGRGDTNHPGYDTNTVRRAAALLSRNIIATGNNNTASIVARILTIMHTGTSLRTVKRQRTALIQHTRGILQSSFLSQNSDLQVIQSEFAKEIVNCATKQQISAQDSGDEADKSACTNISDSIHKSTLSLLTTLGSMGGSYEPDNDEDTELDDESKQNKFASEVCITNVSSLLASNLQDALEKVESLSPHDVEVFSTPTGTLVRSSESSQSADKAVKRGGKHLSEDEEWELQMKKELEEKKKQAEAGGSGGMALSEEDKNVIKQQDIERERMKGIVNGDFSRCLDAIRYLCSSDIEVGNKCLPVVSENVLKAAISICPVMTASRQLKEQSIATLTVLGSCVYEIEEVYAPSMVTALLISCRRFAATNELLHDASIKNETITVSALPSPCPPAAAFIDQMDEFHDTLSGASFAFLFPIIQACLMGIRTPPGCEGALRVLSRHTVLLAGDAVVASLRKDMVVAVLELMKYDRAMTFYDPTPFEVLIDCYRTTESTNNSPPLTTAELAPLLDERGALGSTNCRIAALRAIASIAKVHRKFIKSNPLVENRIWLNCFDQDEAIRSEARNAWRVVHDMSDTIDGDELASMPPPSPLYAISLLPLLNHADSLIAQSAATAYAHAMRMHPSSVSRSIEMLCKTYIDALPNISEVTNGGGTLAAKPKTTTATIAAPAKKKPIATGLPKKKTVAPKSSLEIAGIGKPKVVKKKPIQHSELLKPKQERTLDEDEIASMFKSGPVATKNTEDKDTPAKITIRTGIIRAIASISDASIKIAIDETTLTLLTSFLMAYGIADMNDDVKGSARNALRDVVASYGNSKEAIAFLLPHLESVLKTGAADDTSLGNLSKDKVPKDVSASDRRKEGAVVALGSVAIHLQGAENDEKVDNTVDMLLAALKTPSEEVQQSVADALTKLMKKGRTGDRIESILNLLLKDCLASESLAARRGAAYGLSAVVKGSGIAMLKKHDIVKQLEEACTTGASNSKEGALFAIELLSSRLGLLFEPYVIVLLPSLLKAFSDSSDHVRAAANETTSLIMSKLSAHGVKLVMPAVLMAFNDPAWRTKQASIRMLGSMSHLAPKQLASALPKVVPQLTEAFSDTHPKVKATAQEALNEISTVIKNPEVSSISSVLLKALTDPADYTIKALEALIGTEFLHAIDAPSLALIVPILHRGLRDRGATTKRFGGLIAGNICTMINDPKDFVPYLPTLLPDIQTALLDPIPDVRSTAAKALGSLTRSLGEQMLSGLRPWLMQNLRDDTNSSAERSGAAQGLTEVLIASGSEIVEEAMREEILPLRSYPESSTREGVLWMLTFLPPALGQGFTPLIDASLPALIAGLSDDSEPVREVAMRAGRVLIRSHGKVHVDKILPSLEAGLSDEDHRIRIASLSLLGDLLSLIGGTQVIRGDGDTQDDIRKAERAQAQIALALGVDTRKRVLSSLYLARSDTVHSVRQSAIQVWKTVVSVTARTLRDILPVLVSKIVNDLASGNEEKTDVAGRCLGDLVSKLGDSVLPQIIPVLRNALYDGNEHTKRGVCVGLTEVINCSTKDQILKFIEIIIKVVQDALSDDNESVRKIAASSFQSLHNVVGSRALDEVVPSLMVALERGDDEKMRVRALNGLTGILSIRSRELLPYIIPRLVTRPITLNHARALAGVAEVAGATIHYHFGSIIPALLAELADTESTDEDRRDAITQCAKTLSSAVDEFGVNSLISEVAAKCSSDKAIIRTACCHMFNYIATGRAEKQDYFEQIPIIIRELVYRLNDENASVLKATNEAFTSLSKFVPAAELVKHVEFMRNVLASMVSESRRRKGGVGDGEFLLPGFNIPKGVEPLIPIFQQGILYGSPTIREVSATGLGEVIGYTSAKFLAGPLIVKVTGPLLRVVGDRNPSNVKVAILKTLGLVLVKGGPALRAFVPQFQTTFVKALSDPSRQVRVEAITALSLLMPLATRVDPLIKELVAGALGKNLATEGVAAAAVQTATLDALATVLEKGGTKAKLPESFTAALDCSKDLISSPDMGIRESAAKVMGVYCSLQGPEETTQILRNDVLINAASDSAEKRHGSFCAIRRILATDVGAKLNDSLIIEMKKLTSASLNDDKDMVRQAVCVALCAVIGRGVDPKASMRRSEPDLLKIINNSREPIDIHRAIARGLCVALLMIEPEKRIDFMGLTLVDSSLQLALNSSQRVQVAINEVLWLALDVPAGEGGLEKYCSLAFFENQRSMKSLHSKVLMRIKELSILEN